MKYESWPSCINHHCVITLDHFFIHQAVTITGLISGNHELESTDTSWCSHNYFNRLSWAWVWDFHNINIRWNILMPPILKQISQQSWQKIFLFLSFTSIGSKIISKSDRIGSEPSWSMILILNLYCRQNSGRRIDFEKWSIFTSTSSWLQLDILSCL